MNQETRNVTGQDTTTTWHRILFQWFIKSLMTCHLSDQRGNFIISTAGAGKWIKKKIWHVLFCCQWEASFKKYPHTWTREKTLSGFEILMLIMWHAKPLFISLQNFTGIIMTDSNQCNLLSNCLWMFNWQKLLWHWNNSNVMWYDGNGEKFTQMFPFSVGSNL